MKRARDESEDASDASDGSFDSFDSVESDEDTFDPRADLQSAARARALLMPNSARVVHAVGWWPSGAEIDADVLVLGEAHHIRGIGGGMSVERLVELAVERAAEVGVCVDVFIEDALVPSTTQYPRQREFHEQSIARFSRWLRRDRPDRPTNLRVHSVDSRAEFALHDTGDLLFATARQRVPLTAWQRRSAERSFAWLVGTAPMPTGAARDLRDTMFRGDADETEIWLDLQAAYVEKVRKRARGMQRRDVGHLVKVAFETIEWTADLWWSDLVASAMDYYAVLRMLAPYADRPERPSNVCGPPRHCIMYAGSYHSDHVFRMLCRLCGYPVGVASQPSRAQRVAMRDVVEVGPGGERPIDSVGRLLEAIGLPPIEGVRVAPASGDPMHVMARYQASTPSHAVQAAIRDEDWPTATALIATGMYHRAFSFDDLTLGLVELVRAGEAGVAARLLYEAVRHGGFVPTDASLSVLGRINAGVGAGEWLPRITAVCRNWPVFVRANMLAGGGREWTALPARHARQARRIEDDVELMRQMQQMQQMQDE